MNFCKNYLENNESVTNEFNVLFDEGTVPIKEMQITDQLAENFTSLHATCDKQIQQFSDSSKVLVDEFCSVSPRIVRLFYCSSYREIW